MHIATGQHAIQVALTLLSPYPYLDSISTIFLRHVQCDIRTLKKRAYAIAVKKAGRAKTGCYCAFRAT